MTVYYVDVTTGDDSENNGLTERLAWQSLHHAIDTMSDGDKCWVKASADYVVEDGANDCILYVDTTASEYYTFEGYHTTPGDGGVATLNAGTGALTYAIDCASTSDYYYYLFKHIRFTGAASSAMNVAMRGAVYYMCCSDNNGGYGFNTYYGKTIGCVAYNNTSSGFYNIPLITHCISYGNGSTEIYNQYIQTNCLTYDVTGRAIINNSSAYSSITMGNTLDGDNVASSKGIYQDGAGNRRITVINNIIYDFDEGICALTDFGEYNIINNNLMYSNNTDYTNCADYGDDVDGTEDPFVDSANRDYRLKSNSEAKAAGMDVNAIHDYWKDFLESASNPPSMGVSTTDIGAIQSNPHRTAKQRRHGV